MALKAELGVKIDTGGLVATLGSRLGTATAGLDGIALPAADGQLAAAGQATARIEFGGIAAGAGPLAGQMQALVAGLPGAGTALAPIEAGLALAEELLQADPAATLGGLAELLGRELEGGGEGDFIATLIRIADTLATAPQGAVLKGLLGRLAGLAGAAPAAGGFGLPQSGLAEAVPAVAAGVRMLGALMALETVLAEAERLAAIMARQLDPERIAKPTGTLEACVAGGGTALPDFVAGLDPGNPAEVQAAVAAIDLCGGRLGELVDAVGEGMAFGEATLVYLDMPNLKTEVATAAGLVRETDPAPIERSLRILLDPLAPALDLDLGSAPAFGLDELLSQIEARVAGLAAGIAGLDASVLAGPLTAGLDRVAALPDRLSAAITAATAAVRGALDGVRNAVAALPLGALADAIRAVLGPIADALELIGRLVEAVKAALTQAVAALKTVLGSAEAAVDEFRAAVEALFEQAAAFIDSLELDRVIGAVADNIKAFADLVARARMKPYFDAATGAIGTATAVVEKVPFSLLPDSMEGELVAAVRPVKQVDIAGFQAGIESLLEIGPDGRFALRPEIEAALAGIQAKYDELIAEIRRHDLHQVAASLDATLGDLAERIRAVSPRVELAPLQQAIDGLRAAVGGFDPDAVLAPLRDGFDAVLAAVDEYAPGTLIEPLEQRVDAARGRLTDAIRLADWADHVDLLEARATELIDRLDPARFEPQVRAALDEALATLDALPQLRMAGGFGALVAALLGGSGMRINPLAFDAVLDWLSGASGSGRLQARTAAIAASIAATRAAVDGFDPAALALRIGPNLTALNAAVAGHPAGPGRDALAAAAARLDAAPRLAALAANRNRYLAAVIEAQGTADVISRTGLSEVDIALGRLRDAVAPFRPLAGLLGGVFARLGIAGFDQGIPGAVRQVFAAAPPARLTAIVVPLFTALRARIAALVAEVLAPLKAAIAGLEALLAAIDLTPLREAVDGIHQEVRQQIAALHPDQVLGDAIAAFAAARQQVVGFDPLADATAALTELRDATARLLGKLDAEAILAKPIGIYDGLLDAFGQLDIETLLAPVLDGLDEIAQQVEQGLDDTVVAFKRLQDALPSKIGSTTISVSVQANVG